MEKIVSLDNSYIKKLRKLKSKKYRDQYKIFLVETPHLIKEAYQSNLLLELIVLQKPNINVNYKLVDEKVMRSLTSMSTIPKEIGVVKFSEKKDIGKKILMLDDIQDPGNLGTIIRSCLAFSFDTIILSDKSVDLYNPKTINATQGTLFYINILRGNLIEIINNLKKENYIIYGTDVCDGVNLSLLEKHEKEVIIMGNEGNGINKEIKKIVDKNIYININKKCESLNVGVAASIILYEFSKRLK